MGSMIPIMGCGQARAGPWRAIASLARSISHAPNPPKNAPNARDAIGSQADAAMRGAVASQAAPAQQMVTVTIYLKPDRAASPSTGIKPVWRRPLMIQVG